jgi:hypothetical protein
MVPLFNKASRKRTARTLGIFTGAELQDCLEVVTGNEQGRSRKQTGIE